MMPATGAAAISAWRIQEAVGMAGLERAAGEWAALWAEHEPRPTWFLHADWIRAHVEAFERPTRLRLLLAYHHDRLCAVLPLIAERVWFRGVPVRRWRAAAGVHALQFDLLSASGERGRAAAEALAAHLCARGGWDVVELRDVPQSGAAEGLLRAAEACGCRTGRWQAPPSPYLDLAAGAGFGATSAAFRTELRRTRRRLLESAGAGSCLRLVRADTAPGALEAALATFYRLEAAGWKGRRGSAISSRAATRCFYDTAARALAAQGVLRLHRLELDGHILAACYGLRSGDRFDVVKWAYDETYARFGPGHLLIEALIQDCLQPGEDPPVRWFFINGPDAAYKRKWTQTRQPQAFLYIFRPGLLGRGLQRLKFGWGGGQP